MTLEVLTGVGLRQGNCMSIAMNVKCITFALSTKSRLNQ